MRSIIASTASMLVLMLAGVPDSAAHELLVGRSATNQLLMHIEGGPAFDLPLSQFPGIPGFAAADPGFVATGDDDPGEGLFIMPTTADIEFLLVAADPHIGVMNDTGTAPLQVGQVYHIGQPLFHNHPLWNSPDGTPNVVYSLSVQLRDRSGQLTDSPVYSIGFRPVPEPAAALLLLVGAAALLRRR